MTDTEDTATWADDNSPVRWEYAQLHWSAERYGIEDEYTLRVHLPRGEVVKFPNSGSIVDALNWLGEDGWEAFATEQTNALVTGELGHQRTGSPVRRRFWLKRPVY